MPVAGRHRDGLGREWRTCWCLDEKAMLGHAVFAEEELTVVVEVWAKRMKVDTWRGSTFLSPKMGRPR
ncbi:hypothetical protein E2P81_ATG05676 [Venturia nashicola]|nr:hypothetical protein E2P81_ATG05676 [Venturia nashicola]